MGRGEGGGGMQRSLDDFAVAPPHNSSVASIHGVPRERVRRTRREPGGKLSNSNPHLKDKISFCVCLGGQWANLNVFVGVGLFRTCAGSAGGLQGGAPVEYGGL